jgi:hypothetical protein
VDNPNVKEMYQALVADGKTPKDAAKEVQQRTGLSAVTGRPINKQLYDSFSKKTGKVIGQYGS